MPEDMPDRMSERMSEDMPERMFWMPQDMPERKSEYLPDRVPERMSEDMPDRMPERMSERMSEDMPDRMSEDMPDRMSEDMLDISFRAVEYVAIYVMVGIIRSDVFFLLEYPADTLRFWIWDKLECTTPRKNGCLYHASPVIEPKSVWCKTRPFCWWDLTLNIHIFWSYWDVRLPRQKVNTNENVPSGKLT